MDLMSLFPLILFWAVTFPGSGTEKTPLVGSGGAGHISHHLVVMLSGGIALIIFIAIIIGWYQLMLWRQRARHQEEEEELEEVIVERPVVPETEPLLEPEPERETVETHPEIEETTETLNITEEDIKAEDVEKVAKKKKSKLKRFRKWLQKKVKRSKKKKEGNV